MSPNPKSVGAAGITFVREPVLPGVDPGHLKMVGQVVTFDLHRTGGKTTREKGEVQSQRWLGLTARGGIPEYELSIVGRSGKAVLARVVEDHVQPIDDPKPEPTR